MSKAKVIVSGGMGYIGSHTVVELAQHGYESIIIDNLSNSDESVLNGIEKIIGQKCEFQKLDLSNRTATLDTFSKFDNIAGIIHFAAHKAVGESVQKPLKYYRNNLNSLFNILEAAKENQIENFIFSSSCTVYGNVKSLPVRETTPISKTFSPYGATKQISEQVISDYQHSVPDFKAISLRYFNPIGAHPTAEIGELPLGKPENLMPYITQTAAGLRDSLSVFGNDYDTEDGTAIRDYIHVVDLANAHVLALKRLLENKNKDRHEFFNLGSGNGYSVLQVIESFERSTGMKLNYSIAERRPGDIPAIYADNQLSKKELNWNPKFTLDDMTSSAWKWEKKIRGITH